MSAIEVHDRQITVERFTVTKGLRILTLLQLIQKMVPQISNEIADFKREYAASNVIELDRVQAKMRYGPTPIIDEHGDVVRDSATGEVLTVASPIDRMTEADWERSGQILRLRQSPSNEEMLLAVFPLVYEHAQAPLMRLLALVAMPNADIERYAQVSGEKLWEEVDEYARQVIGPAYLEQVMELAVTAAEQVEGQVMDKVRGLGDRVGKLAGLLGIKKTAAAPSSDASPTSSEPPEQPSSRSASPSPASSDGSPPTSAPSPGTSSTPSETSSNANTTVNAS
jgi:hypothetical protein